MSASDIGQDDPMIRPTPGENGAFRCAICANGKLRIGWRPETDHAITVRLYCPTCNNWFDWWLNMRVPEEVKN